MRLPRPGVLNSLGPGPIKACYDVMGPGRLTGSIGVPWLGIWQPRQWRKLREPFVSMPTAHAKKHRQVSVHSKFLRRPH